MTAVALILALVLALVATVAAWSVALRLHHVDRIAAGVCMALHARLRDAEAAIATHDRRHDDAAAAIVAAHTRVVLAE